MNLLMSPKRQFKFQMDDDLRERLDVAAKRLGRDTAQEVVEEILVVFFPVWLAVSESAKRAVDYQARLMIEKAVLPGYRQTIWVDKSKEATLTESDSVIVPVQKAGTIGDRPKAKRKAK